jgi:uncharacterized membrane protein YhaH (DUF805 family)
MGFGEAIAAGFSNYVNFNDRASRSEFWFWVLFCFLGGIVAFAIDREIGIWLPITYLLFDIITVVPYIAVAIRRLHDLDRTGWWWLLYFVPTSLGGLSVAYYIFLAGTNYWVAAASLFGVIQIVCWIILLVWFCTRGTNGPNRFGPDPLQAGPISAAPWTA